MLRRDAATKAPYISYGTALCWDVNPASHTSSLINKSRSTNQPQGLKQNETNLRHRIREVKMAPREPVP